MKLLLVSESYWPNLDGGAVFQRRLAHGMADRGHTVVVWAPGRGLRSYPETDGPIRMYRERSFPLPTNRRYRFSLWPFWHAYRIIGRERPDIIHVHAPTQIAVAALMAARRYHIPVIATNHVMPENLVSPKLPAPLFRWASRLIWRYIIWFHNQVQYVITPSPSALRYLQRHHLRPPAQAITSGLDVAAYGPAPKTSERAPSLLYVGRLDAEKNLPILLKAAAILKTQAPFRFDIVGTGNQLASLQRLADRLGVANIVTFHGRLSEADKLKAFSNADIFVIASPAELLSIVTLEAMASGLPVVAARAGALPDLIQDDVTGFLVEPQDAKAFAARSLKLLQSASLRARLGSAGRSLVQEHHSAAFALDSHEQIYRHLINER